MVDFLTLLKEKSIESPTGVIPTVLLMNSYIMDFVDYTSDSYLYCEPSMYIIPGYDLSMNNRMTRELIMEKCNSAMMLCIFYLYIIFLVENESKWCFDEDIKKCKSNKVCKDVILSNITRIMCGRNLKIKNISDSECSLYKRLYRYTKSYRYYLFLYYPVNTYTEKTRQDRFQLYVNVISSRIDSIVNLIVYCC